MRIKLVFKEAIDDYVAADPQHRSSFGHWLMRVKHAQWNDPSDIKRMFNSASFLGRESNRVVFSVGGRNYRMICMYIFAKKNVALWVCWVGTHLEYNELSDRERRYIITKY